MGTGIADDGTDNTTIGAGIADKAPNACIPPLITNQARHCFALCGALQPYALVATGNFEVATCSPFGEPPPPPPPSAVPAAANPATNPAAANPAPSASPTASRPLPAATPASSFTGAPTASYPPLLQPHLPSHICVRTEPHLRRDRATSVHRYGCMGRRQIIGVLSGSFTDGAAAGAQYAAAHARAPAHLLCARAHTR